MNAQYTVNPETATRFFDFAERHGFALHEVHAGDKAPIGADWQHRYSRDLATWQGWLIGGRNIGLHPGASQVAVLDIEAGKQEIAEEWFLKITGYSLPDPHVRSPSGGTHTYFRLTDANGLWTLRQRTTGWGDLLVGSANAMLPPSATSRTRKTTPIKKPVLTNGWATKRSMTARYFGRLGQGASRARTLHPRSTATASRKSPGGSIKNWRPAIGTYPSRIGQCSVAR
ncbi:hypothetical protein ACVWXQ_009936 [Bradyrhizobium sp. S3.14.4]